MIDKITLKEGCFKIEELKPGDVQKHPTQGWYIACPRCGQVCCINTWQITINENKEITISPSIGHPKFVGSPEFLSPNGCGAHYFVRNSKIQWCSDM